MYDLWGDVEIYHCTCAYRKVIFFQRFKNRDTGDNRGADFQNFLQTLNFADPRKTVIPVKSKTNNAQILTNQP